MNEERLLEGIEAKLHEHGLLSEAEGGIFTAMHQAMKANPKLQQELAMAAVDGMVRRLRAEGKKFKGNLGGWRGQVAAGFSSKKELNTFAKMAQGEAKQAVDSLLRKLRENVGFSGGHEIQESAAPGMFRSWVDRLVKELEEAIPNMEMWSTGPKEKLMVAQAQKLLVGLKRLPR